MMCKITAGQSQVLAGASLLQKRAAFIKEKAHQGGKSCLF